MLYKDGGSSLQEIRSSSDSKRNLSDSSNFNSTILETMDLLKSLRDLRGMTIWVFVNGLQRGVFSSLEAFFDRGVIPATWKGGEAFPIVVRLKKLNEIVWQEF